MKAKSAIYYILLFLFIITPIALGYYIFVNTVLANSVLPNIRLNSSDISFYNEIELKDKIQTKALSTLPERIDVNFENEELSIGTQDIELAVDTYDLVNYGKGTDLFKVIAEGLNLVSGVEVNVGYTLNVDKFISKLNLDLNSSKPSVLINSNYSCYKNNYQFNSLDKIRLKSDLVDSIKRNTKFKFDLADYLSNENEKQVYIACLKYKKDYPLITEHVIDKLAVDSLKVENLFELKANGNSSIWKVIDSQILVDYINSYKKSKDIEPQDGEYEIIDNHQIYMYKPYVEGLTIDKDATVASIFSWINSDNLDSDPIIYSKIQPKILSYGLPIIDFTQEMGVGKTRIELIRNGYNNFVIAYTMFGLDEINNYVVNAGEEFSYIKAIDPQPNGTTKSGRPIAGGICNSTTTLFRSVLQSGLPVTDRSYHAYYVPSYEWGYPLNIVDAAYYTDPLVDFKFKNDFDYPILIKVEYSKDADYQYNTVRILSSSLAPKRSVELSNWKVWDKYSSTNFKGSFDRVVSVDGKVIFSDNFYSHYL